MGRTYDDQHGRRTKETGTYSRDIGGPEPERDVTAQCGGATYIAPTGAKDLDELLAEVEVEIEGHPRKDTMGSWAGAAYHEIHQIREHVANGDDAKLAIGLYSLGIYVERMRNELAPAAGGKARRTATKEQMREQLDAWDRMLKRSGTNKKAHAMRQLGIPKATYYKYRRILAK